MTILKKIFGKKSNNCCAFNLDQEIEKVQQKKDEEKNDKKANEKDSACCNKK